MVRSYLENQQYDVNYVVNFTDVDDKLIRKAEEMNLTVPEVAEMFIKAYYEDLDGLGIPRATANPRVTENMEIIIDFIRDLEQKRFCLRKRRGRVFPHEQISGIRQAVRAKYRRTAIRHPH
ncbi:hypothetical protein HMSSN139_56650 [Paenibacillus sp. HMSSN-139]|nr:hypothetical protein HMSSN139_56650 [Paenibacillus sp. HMSSN-139]